MAREAVYIRQILQELGHKQPRTPLQTDNSTAEAIINNKVQPKRTKAMDMRFHWLRDRELQQQLRIYWRSGKLNYADYFTKHHPASHHRNTRKEYLTPQRVIQDLVRESQKAAGYDIGAMKAAEVANSAVRIRKHIVSLHKANPGKLVKANIAITETSVRVSARVC